MNNGNKTITLPTTLLEKITQGNSSNDTNQIFLHINNIICELQNQKQDLGELKSTMNSCVEAVKSLGIDRCRATVYRLAEAGDFRRYPSKELVMPVRETMITTNFQQNGFKSINNNINTANKSVSTKRLLVDTIPDKSVQTEKKCKRWKFKSPKTLWKRFCYILEVN